VEELSWNRMCIYVGYYVQTLTFSLYMFFSHWSSFFHLFLVKPKLFLQQLGELQSFPATCSMYMFLTLLFMLRMQHNNSQSNIPDPYLRKEAEKCLVKISQLVVDAVVLSVM
jgi:hypothetical protein